MAYPEFLVAPMRQELTRLGIEELRTVEQVDEALAQKQGTILVVVNSVCGCAAGRARPGVALALQHTVRPDRAVTVFAGADIEATAQARRFFVGYQPSSPQIALFRDGKLVFMLERYQIEGREAPEIATLLTNVFDEFCVKQPQ